MEEKAEPQPGRQGEDWSEHCDLHAHPPIPSAPWELGAGSPQEAVCRGQPPGHQRMGLQNQENTQHRTLSDSHKVVDLGANWPAGISVLKG